MRPNILYVHSHDTGRYVQPYGHPVATPQIQKLAEQGVLLRQAFCAGPTCSPSRAALLTGQSPHSCGMLGLAHRGFSLTDYSRHLVQHLGRNGYVTGLAGFEHESGTEHIGQENGAARIGYDEFRPGNRGETWSERTADTAAGGLELLGRFARQDRPFFLSVGFTATHREWDRYTAEADGRYVMPPAPIPDTPETRADWAGFQRLAGDLDEGVGRVLAGLDERGLAENTLVICTTDHGIAFPDMKCNLTDHGLGVMLILRGPGGWRGGTVLDAMVSQIDLYPTVCELAGIETPPWVEGASMMPLLRGEVEQLHEEIYGEVTYHAAYEPKRCVRTQRYKYIRRFDGRERIVRPNCDDSPSRQLWISCGWYDRPVASERLYDLVFDPQERRNLAEDNWHRQVLQDMRARLAAWMERTDDPLLQGEVPPPPGVKINLPDQDLPSEPPYEVPVE